LPPISQRTRTQWAVLHRTALFLRKNDRLVFRTEARYGSRRATRSRRVTCAGRSSLWQLGHPTCHANVSGHSRATIFANSTNRSDAQPYRSWENICAMGQLAAGSTRSPLGCARPSLHQPRSTRAFSVATRLSKTCCAAFRQLLRELHVTHDEMTSIVPEIGFSSGPRPKVKRGFGKGSGASF